MSLSRGLTFLLLLVSSWGFFEKLDCLWCFLKEGGRKKMFGLMPERPQLYVSGSTCSRMELNRVILCEWDWNFSSTQWLLARNVFIFMLQFYSNGAN